MVLPQLIDFEASGLGPFSYPIEVAWSSPSGEVEAHLISPAAVSEWTHWDWNAQVLHGLSREKLIAEGEPPAAVARRMNTVLRGRVVFSDSVPNDRFWADVLFEAAGLAAEFTIDDFWRLLARLGIRSPDELGPLLEHAAGQVNEPEHRAAPDVRWLLAVVKTAMHLGPE